MYADVPHDALVARISNGRPEVDCPGTIDFNQHRGSLDSPLPEDLLDLTHESTTDSQTPMFGRDHQPIEIAAPAIERPEQRTDDRVLHHREQEDRRWVLGDAAHTTDFIGRAHAGSGIDPEPQDRFGIVGARASKFQVHRNVERKTPYFSAKQ